jgi:broad specificity phosphatase PhoE
MTTNIYFVRHGIAPFSLELERAGGASLSEQGKADAKRVAELLGSVCQKARQQDKHKNERYPSY